MAPRSFRDRFFTPRVARAIMSPLGIVLFGVGTAGAILGGLGVLAPLVGAGLWGGNVLRAVPRDAKPFRVDAGKLLEPWRTYVADARQARQRFQDVIGSISDGPLTAKLTELLHRLDDAVAETDRIATRGNALAVALDRLDTVSPQAELARIAAQHDDSPETAATIESLRAQLETAQRISTAASQANSRLRMLDARYDELVARAVEVSLGTGDSEGLGLQVDDLVTELEALRRALDETNAISAGQPLPSPVVE